MVMLKSSFVVLAAYLASVSFVAGKLYESIADVPKGVQFDYIIVGGECTSTVVVLFSL